MISPELRAQIEAERQRRAEKVAQVWRDGLTPRDWLFDGHEVKGKVMEARFANLDWDKAWGASRVSRRPSWRTS